MTALAAPDTTEADVASLGTSPAHGRLAESATVEMVDVVKDYGNSLALSGFSLSMRPGELVALLGPSGCGKTTALRTLAGLTPITSGTIKVDGEAVAHLPTNKRDMGMVFQSYSLFPHMTAMQNVEYGLRMRKVAKEERRERSAEMLKSVGLEALGHRYAHELSGGQQQRVALARALVTRPSVLLLDEPLSALDAKVRVELRELIRRIQTELRITTLFVTHDQEEALAMADRVAVMSDGIIRQIGTPEELYSRPKSAFVADFVGLSNRVPGLLSAGTVTAYGTTFALLGEPLEDGPVVALVRPEDVLIVEGGLPAVVLTSSFLGSLRRTVVRLDDGVLLTIQHAASDPKAPGSRVSVAFRGQPVSALKADQAS
ncbi:MAG: ABC transporter ATP-binding protein [Demequinaceae bacterium]|nr:ABC transporter ATP-binding protein [Demequinaceae bacterium]